MIIVNLLTSDLCIMGNGLRGRSQSWWFNPWHTCYYVYRLFPGCVRLRTNHNDSTWLF